MPFDPSAPFDLVSDPGFDPTKPFKAVEEPEVPGFDPTKPFTVSQPPQPPAPEAPHLDLRTFQKTASGEFTGPEPIDPRAEKKKQLLREMGAEHDQPTWEKLGGQAEVAPLAARGGLQKTVAGIFRTIERPISKVAPGFPVLSWLLSESGKKDIYDAEEFGEMVGGGKLGKAVQGFVNTAIQSAPTLAAGPGGISAMATVAGAQTFGSVEEDAFNAYREQGLSTDEAKSKALGPAVIGGVVTAGLTRFVPGGGERLAQAVMRGEISQIAAQGIVKTIVKDAALEFTEEALDQISQGVVEKLSYNPNKTWTDIYEESLQAGGYGALLGGGTRAVVAPIAKVAQAVSEPKTAKLENKLRSVSEELAQVRARLAQLRGGFTRTPVTPDVESGLREAVEPGGDTPMDLLLSASRAIVPRGERGFTRTPVTPDTDQSLTLVEPAGETPIDQLLARSRAVVPRGERGFVRTATTPDTDQSGTLVEPGGVTPVDEAIAGSRRLMRLPEGQRQRRVAPPEPATKPLPPGTRITVQPAERINGETMPGYVQIDLVENGVNTRSTNPEQLAREGYSVPDFSTVPKGQYTFNERGGLDAIQKQQTAPVPVREQAKAGPQVVPEVRQQGAAKEKKLRYATKEESQTPVIAAIATPAGVFTGRTHSEAYSAGRQAGVSSDVLENGLSGFLNKDGNFLTRDAVNIATGLQGRGLSEDFKLGLIQAADLSVVGSDDSLKTPIDILFDPGAQSGQSDPSMVKGYLAINPKGKNKGQVLVQVRQGGKTRTVFTAPLAQLEQSGAITRTAEEEFEVDPKKLFSSGLFTKNPERALAPYKLPTDVATRSVEPEAGVVVGLVEKLNPKVGAILRALHNDGIANLAFLRNLAVVRSIENLRSAREPSKLAKQVVDGLRRYVSGEAKDATDPQLKDTLLGLNTWLNSSQPVGVETPQLAASVLSGLDTFHDRLVRPKSEVEDAATVESDEGEEISRTETAAVWDPARVDSIIGLIEDRDPKLYESFSAPATDDKAWDNIEKQLVKFLNGDAAAAEMLAESIRQRRAEGWVAQLGEDKSVQDAIDSGLTEDEAQQLNGAPIYFYQENGKKSRGVIHHKNIIGDTDRVPGTEGEWITGFTQRVKIEDVGGVKMISVVLDGTQRIESLPADQVFFDSSKTSYSTPSGFVQGPKRTYSTNQLPGQEFPELEAEHRWQTGLSAKGKQGIIDLLKNRQIPFEPELRRIGLALLERVPDKYLADLTVSVAEEGSLSGEFIPWLKVARIAMNTANSGTAAHEIAHYLASFLGSGDRAAISKMRADELALLRKDPAAKEFTEWLDSVGGSAMSSEYGSGYDAFQKVGTPHTYYHLINDDEYLAHYVSKASAKAPAGMDGIVARAKDVIRRIITAIKAWVGNRDAYFDQLLSRLENGEFDVNTQGGMLFEQNNGNRPQALPPIKSLTELRKYRGVDQGTEEQRQVNTLTFEQNEPIVGGDVAERFSALPREIRSELPGIAGRLAAMQTAQRAGIGDEHTPLRAWATIVNWLHLKEEGKTLNDSIQADLDKLTRAHKDQPKVSAAEARARALDETARGLISGYKDYLLSEQRKNQNSGLAAGLAEAVKNLDSLQKSTTALERAVQYLSEVVSLQDLMSPQMSTGALIDLFKRRLAEGSNVSDWQNASIPSGDGKPGVSNDQLRIAIRLMQQRQGLVQDILTYKQLSDPDTMKAISESEGDFDKEIETLNRNQLQSFLKSYYSVRSSKDKARQIYLKHRRRVGELVERINRKASAQDWLSVNVLNSPRLQQALGELSQRGFMSADLIEDGQGSAVLKRVYHNPLNREQTITITDGTTRKDYQQNLEKFEQVQEWYAEALSSDQLDPLDRQLISLEYARIDQEEMNEAFNPETGKRSPGAFNLPNIIANLRGNTLQFAMEKIGGRAAIKAIMAGQLMAEGKRRVANARKDGQYQMQQFALEASRDHEIGNQRWLNEVADPILASHNSLGAKQMQAGDVTRYGHKVTQKDMKAVREMKRFIDSIAEGVTEISSHTAKTHPILTKEIVAGRPVYREKQGHSELIVPRRIRQSFRSLVEQWNNIKGPRKAVDVMPQLASFLSQGEAFREMLLSHIYSSQKYPDYVGKSRFGKAYREIYNDINDGREPANLADVVDAVFDEQAGQDASTQLSKDEILKAIISEIDGIASRIGDDERMRSSESSSPTVSIESGDNFLTKPRGEMIAPDSAYQYSVLGNNDVRWLINSAMEVMAQRTRNALEKVEGELRAWLDEFGNRAKHPHPQKESRARQIAGEDWLNYREAKQMLLQVRKLLDTLTPGGVRMFADEQLSGIGNRLYSVLIQNLLQSVPVMARNVFGYNTRRSQFESEVAGDTLWMGIPRWLIRLPGETLKGRGLVYPIVNTVRTAQEALAYRSARKAGLTEKTLRAMVHNPKLMESAGGAVKAGVLRAAVNAQRFRDLGAGERYGIGQQIERYIKQFYYGGDVEALDPNNREKFAGALKSILGLIEETGGGVMLPRFLAPRKLEMFLNSDAMKVAQDLLEDVELNLREAIRDRAELGRMDAPITDAELLGVHKADKGDALYLRNMFTRSGLNLGFILRRMAQEPEQPLLRPAEFDTFAQEVAKETNMSSDDNRPRYKSGFGRMMGALTGYAFWYGERQAQSYAPSSRKGGVDPAALYRAMMFTGLIVATGLVGTPLIRFLKKSFYDEEDMTGRFSSDNTAWRNAAVLWEQTGYYWPIIGSIMNQLYDARTGSKSLNLVPIGMAQNILQTANEIGQTGNAFYPTVRLLRSMAPNTKVVLNRLPQTEGLVEVNNANRILRETADGSVEVRKPTPGKVNYSPATTQIQMAVNELSKANPDWTAIEYYRREGAKEYIKKGSSPDEALERFDRSVMVRIPQNTVYGRPLTADERNRQFTRMSDAQRQQVTRVENAFVNYSNRFGMREPDLVQKPRRPRVRSAGGLGRVRGSRSRLRVRRPRSLLRGRNRRLTRGV